MCTEANRKLTDVVNGMIVEKVAHEAEALTRQYSVGARRCNSSCASELREPRLAVPEPRLAVPARVGNPAV